MCRHCTFCAAGSYNEGCNTRASYQNKNPQGECKRCKLKCDVGYFMRHSAKDAGCHAPPQHQTAPDKSGLWMISSDYTCERCPTWFKQGGSLKAVTACGLNTKYLYFNA